MSEYAQELYKDLLEQFKDKKNTLVLIKALGRQLDELYDFYEQLRTERTLSDAVGAQLDGIGDIEVLSRAEAGLLAGDPIPYDVIDDDRYRRFLIWKILKNTSRTTYPDIIKAFKMFWDRPLYYQEDPKQPATMIFDTGEMEGLVDTTPLFETPLIRAAGVTLKLYATTKTELEDAPVGLASGLGYSVTITELPFLEREFDFGTTVSVGANMERITEDRLPTLERNYYFRSKVYVGADMSRVTEDRLPFVEREFNFAPDLHSGSAVQSVMVTPIGDMALQ